MGARSLMGGCGLSHERVEDGCKNTCEVWGLLGNGLINIIVPTPTH